MTSAPDVMHICVLGAAFATAFAGANAVYAVMEDAPMSFLSAIAFLVLAVVLVCVGVP